MDRFVVFAVVFVVVVVVVVLLLLLMMLLMLFSSSSSLSSLLLLLLFQSFMSDVKFLFAGDVGGLMGLWLGASVLTWVELFEVVCNLLNRRCMQPQRNKSTVGKSTTNST